MPGILSRFEKIILALCIAGAIGSSWFLIDLAYKSRTNVVPADAGSFNEGIVGTPRFLNPLYADSNDVDRDISALLFSGLLTYGKDKELTLDLAKNYSVSEDGTIYDFVLRDDIYWSDGEKITTDDVLYTIALIQDPAYKSPLRAQWMDIQTEKISDISLRLKLKAASAPFLEYCALKILPKHIWENISAEDFPLSPYNLDPVASGPYKVKKINRDKDNTIVSLLLAPNSKYYGSKPHIQEFLFSFFNDNEGLTASFRRGIVKGFAMPEPSGQKNLAIAGAQNYTFTLPRYFTLFFNPENNKLLDDVSVRQALSYAINKQEIINSALGGAANAVNSPILPDFYGFKNPDTRYDYNIEQARQLLDKAGFILGSDGIRNKKVDRKPAFQFLKNLTLGSKIDPDVKELQKCLAKEVAPELEITGSFGQNTKNAVNKFQEKYRADILDANDLDEPTGDVKQATREKLNAVCFPSGSQTSQLAVTITTADDPMLVKVAQIIKSQWEAVGAKIELKIQNIDDFGRESLKPRKYDVLLFGEVMGLILDPYPFWHSSQKIDPGLNLAQYQSKDADKAIEEARKAVDAEARLQPLENFQEILLKDAPAVFLYNPGYLYIVSDEIKGIESQNIASPSQRFFNVQNWYIKEKRVWK